MREVTSAMATKTGSIFDRKFWLISKNFPTDPWSIPQTPNQQFMTEFLSFEGLGMSGATESVTKDTPMICHVRP